MTEEINISQIRVGLFFIITIVLFFLEKSIPLKKFTHFYHREKTNILLFLFGIVVTRLTLPMGLYYFESQSSWQLDWIDASNPILSYLVFDFALYWQHRWFHEVNLLWRFHRVHHIDTRLTLSTGFRFHPLEIFFSLLYKILLCVFLKLSPLGLLVFEIALNASSLFTHANIKIHPKVRTILGYLIMTPNLHHIHHSQEGSEQRSNYGFIFTIWDKLFRTFTPEKKKESIQLGVKGYGGNKAQNVTFLLKSPWQD